MDVLELTAQEVVRRMRKGTLGVEDYCRAIIARAEHCAGLNAFATFAPERLIAKARELDFRPEKNRASAALFGLPLGVKDNIDTAHLPTTAGTPALADNQPAGNAPALARLLAAGALVAGKTNMHELAFGITSDNAAFGAVANPYDPTRIPGGSSGGSAAAVAARIVPAALGTDTGGSMRIPAALCGVVGFRPTTGRYPAEGVVPLSHTRDTIGPMARRVADVAMLDAVLAGEKGGSLSPSLKGKRLGVPRAHFYDDLDGDVARLVEAALAWLGEAGAVLVEADIGGAAAPGQEPVIKSLSDAVGFPVVFYESPRDLATYLSRHDLSLNLETLIRKIASPDVRGLLKQAIGPEAVLASLYQKVLGGALPRLKAAYAAYFSSHDLDAIVFPTTPAPAHALLDDGVTVRHKGHAVSAFSLYIRNTEPGSNAGIPGISVPCGLTGDGLPVGLEFDAPQGADRHLLAIAAAFEATQSPLPSP